MLSRDVLTPVLFLLWLVLSGKGTGTFIFTKYGISNACTTVHNAPRYTTLPVPELSHGGVIVLSGQLHYLPHPWRQLQSAAPSHDAASFASCRSMNSNLYGDHHIASVRLVEALLIGRAQRYPHASEPMMLV